jgi:hypothetical protein
VVAVSLGAMKMAIVDASPYSRLAARQPYWPPSRKEQAAMDPHVRDPGKRVLPARPRSDDDQVHERRVVVAGDDGLD